MTILNTQQNKQNLDNNSNNNKNNSYYNNNSNNNNNNNDNLIYNSSNKIVRLNMPDPKSIDNNIKKNSSKENIKIDMLLKDNAKTATHTTSSVLHRKKHFTFTAASNVGSNASFSSASVAGSIQDDTVSDQCSLTQAGLEEYNIRASSYYDQPVLYHHQKQSSYAQSEGYHSYVSSSDSNSTTPFLDRFRQESELLSRQSLHLWSSQNDLSSVSCNSVPSSPTPLSPLDGDGSSNSQTASTEYHQEQQQQFNNSSESTSSTETLKWLGSMSNISEASHVTGYSTISESVSSSQLIVHSSCVLTPKRHHSEGVLHRNEEQRQPEQQLHQKSSPSSLEDQHNLRFSPALSSDPAPVRSSSNHQHCPSYPPMHSSVTLHPFQQQQHQASPKNEIATSIASISSSVAVTVNKNNFSNQSSAPTPVLSNDLREHKQSICVTLSNSEDVVKLSPSHNSLKSSNDNVVGIESSDTYSALSESKTSITTTTSTLTSTVKAGAAECSTFASTIDQSILAVCSASITSTSAHRSNHHLFPVSTYPEPVHSNTSQYVLHPKPQYSVGLQKTAATLLQQQQVNNNQISGTAQSLNAQLKHSPTLNTPTDQPNWQSVAEIINDFERSSDQQPSQKYTYIEPNKIRRVSNPALKAFQKNAVQSYFERQQQQLLHHSNGHNQPHKNYHPNTSLQHQHQQQRQPQEILRPHSYQAKSSPKEVGNHHLLRNSLPDSYSPSEPRKYNVIGQLHQHHVNATTVQMLPSQPSVPTTIKSALPTPPPPPPRSRSLMPHKLLRRSSSASDYADFRDQYHANDSRDTNNTVNTISSSEILSFNDSGMTPPPPPPRAPGISMTTRRTSFASEYVATRKVMLLQEAAEIVHQQQHPHQHIAHQHLTRHDINTNHYLPPPLISIDGWAPERPPKNPSLRVPSPDLPPPPKTDVDTNLSDEPLPPPPPEILHRQQYGYDGTSSTFNNEIFLKPPPPNRRNSFTGSSKRRSFYNRAPSTTACRVSPMIPKKPTGIEMLLTVRSPPTVAQQSRKPHKTPQLSYPQKQQREHQSSASQILNPTKMHAISANRKRVHNPAYIAIPPPILENATINTTISSLSESSSINKATETAPSKPSPPPPALMPRISSSLSQGPIIESSGNQKCNSKVSYLPRQSLEKINSYDPDHGSYKLTLTSNEDLITSTKPAYNFIIQNGRISSNLPDVLPLDAKLQQQLSSPANDFALRYNSKTNVATTPNSQSIVQKETPSCYQLYPSSHHRYSTPAMISNTTNNSSSNVPSFTRSQSLDTNNASPMKFMSQSTIDLNRKTTNHLGTTIEETLSENSNVLAPVQSEKNLSSNSPTGLTMARNSSLVVKVLKPLSPNLAKREFHLSDGSIKLCRADERSQIVDGRRFSAELINTKPHNASVSKSVTRKNSLRENIEKITQLQSKLMSAHLADSGILGVHHTRPISTNSQIAPTPKTPHSEESKYVLTSGESATENIIPTNNSSRAFAPEQNTSNLCGTEKTLSSTPSSPVQAISYPEGAVVVSATKTIMAALNHDDKATMKQISQINSCIDSLKLIQCSEIVLRLNPCTAETASQTDDILDTDMGRLTVTSLAKEGPQIRTTLQPRLLHPIEINCDKISRDLVSLLSPNDKIINILMPKTIKTPMDFVNNLYNPNVPFRPTKRDVGTSTFMQMKSHDVQITSCTSTASDRNVITMDLPYKDLDLALMNCNDMADRAQHSLKKKINELMKQLNRKIQILNTEQATMRKESAINDDLGKCLLSKLTDKFRPIDTSKFRTYIDDVGHITSLLLSLAERLAKTENILSTIAENSIEKKTLESKRDHLLDQLQEAKHLKEDINRRGSSVTSILKEKLTTDDLADFDYFINMKAKLIVDARDIADKIKCGEEQLNALSEALTQTDC